MLANCCAVSPVSFRMVGASAASMVRWKNESHEHAAIAKHGTHICQVTAARSAAVGAVTVFTPVVVDINFSSGVRGTHSPPYPTFSTFPEPADRITASVTAAP